MPKFQLKPAIPAPMLKKKLKPLLPKNFLLEGTKLHYSGYALTDNLIFVLFGVSEQFVLDKFIQDDILGFNFVEESVDMKIDRNVSYHPIIGDTGVKFETFGVIEKQIFDLILLHSPRCSFMPVIEWFGETVSSLLCCLSESGKPVAVIKTI